MEAEPKRGKGEKQKPKWAYISGGPHGQNAAFYSNQPRMFAGGFFFIFGCFLFFLVFVVFCGFFFFFLALLGYDKLNISHSYHYGFHIPIAPSIHRTQTVLNDLYMLQCLCNSYIYEFKIFFFCPRPKINICSVFLDSLSVPSRQPETVPCRLDYCPSAGRKLPAPIGSPRLKWKVG